MLMGAYKILLVHKTRSHYPKVSRARRYMVMNIINLKGGGGGGGGGVMHHLLHHP